VAEVEAAGVTGAGADGAMGAALVTMAGTGLSSSCFRVMHAGQRLP